MPDRALTPKYCLTKMAAALSAMEAAQDRFAEISGAYAGTQAAPTLDDIAAGGDPRLRSAISDTGYYQAQAATYAACASALLAGLERYQPRHRTVADDDLRDCKPVVGEAVAAGFAINTGDKRRWPDV